MPKCASTTLQHFYAKNDEAHAAAGFCYPRAFREETGYRSHLPLLEAAPSELEGAVSAIADEAAARSCDRILISCEGFAASLLDDQQVGRVLGLLNNRFGSDNVTCLLLVRNQFHLTESLYSQFLRGGMYEVPDSVILGKPDSGIAEFVDAFESLYGFEAFEYAGFHRLLRGMAPDNRVEVTSVETADLGGANVVDHLSRRFGLPEQQADRRDVNRRVSGKALLALHRARSEYPFSHFERRRQMLLQAFAGTEDGVSSLLHLSRQLTERVRRTSIRDSEYFAGFLDAVPQEVYRIPAGFPRDFTGEMSLTEAERDTVRYVMEADEPALPVAKRLRLKGNPPRD